MNTIPRSFSKRPLLTLACWTATLWFTSLSHADPKMDWPHWRGPEQNGISREVGLVDSWNPRGENLLWEREDLGTISTPIVMDGKLYVLCRADEMSDIEGERVVCVNAATGETIWETKFNVFLSDVPAERVGWSSVVGDPETGKVYALGVCDLFMCLDGKTGETLWSVPMSEQFGMLNTYGGRTNFPVIHEDLVIISGVIIGWGEMARPTHRFVAFDKATGEVVWFTGTTPLPEDTTYSTPILGSFNGQLAMVAGSGDGRIWAIQPRTGVPIWNYRLSRRGVNTSPLVVGDKVYVGQSEENIHDNTMGAIAALDGTLTGEIDETGELWRIKERMVGKSSPILVDGRIYAIEDNGGLLIVNPESGEVLHRQKLGTVMRSSPLYADGKIYACTANGRWYILEPDGDKVKVLHQLRLRSTGCYGSPIVSHGRIYLPTTSSLYCIGKEDHEPKLAQDPVQLEEAPLEDETPAHVQLVPAESLIRPGETLTFRAKLYNAKGQFLRNAEEVEFSVDNFGEIAADGTYSPSSEAAHVASIVTAKVGDLEANARVRIVPDLPWKFDFSNGEIPITWVGARYRHVVRDLDGDYAMVKITTIPKGTRSQSWMGHPDFHDFTIQADMLGRIDGNQMPDMGVIAQRYTLDLKGSHQQLQIRTWPAQLRMASTVPFEWKPDVWYTLKLQASNEGDRAVLRGKVWERDKPEPEEWTVEAVDKSPNRTGSPGLFGNATNAEILIDNIKVTPNE